jgi:hypothetical protein
MMLHYTYKSIEQARFYEDGISNKNSQDEGYLKEGYKKEKGRIPKRDPAFSKEDEK